MTLERKVDFPTLGKPINPTSANSFNSKMISFSCPFSPSCENLGTCLVEVAKCTLPFPPLPPGSTSSFCFSSDKSARTRPCYTISNNGSLWNTNV